MDYLKKSKEMAKHFHGIDDGLGGTFLPVLPSVPADASANRTELKDRLRPTLKMTEDLGKLELTGAPTARSAFSSPTSTLDAGFWSSPLVEGVAAEV